MNALSGLEELLNGFCGEPHEVRELRRLVAQLPESIGDFPPGERPRSQPVVLQALYYLGDLSRLEKYATPSYGAEADLWLGYALFDTERYREAADRFLSARDQLRLATWAQCKVDELLLCCRIYTEPGSLSVNDFRELAELRRQAEEHAPEPKEIERALKWAEDCGALTEADAQSFANAIRA